MYHQRTFIYKTHPILVLYIPLKTSTQHMCFTVCDSSEACNEQHMCFTVCDSSEACNEQHMCFTVCDSSEACNEQHMCFTVCDSYEACNEHNYVNSLQCNRSIEIMLL